MFRWKPGREPQPDGHDQVRPDEDDGADTSSLPNKPGPDGEVPQDAGNG